MIFLFIVPCNILYRFCIYVIILIQYCDGVQFKAVGHRIIYSIYLYFMEWPHSNVTHLVLEASLDWS